MCEHTQDFSEIKTELNSLTQQSISNKLLFKSMNETNSKLITVCDDMKVLVQVQEKRLDLVEHQAKQQSDAVDTQRKEFNDSIFSLHKKIDDSEQRTEDRFEHAIERMSDKMDHAITELGKKVESINSIKLMITGGIIVVVLVLSALFTEQGLFGIITQLFLGGASNNVIGG